jgi:hypothetical protein
VISRPAPDRRPLFRLLAAAAVVPLLPVWALWRDVYMLDASGVVRVGGAPQVAEWAVYSVVTAGLAALFWSRHRAARVVGYTLYSLVISVGFGAAGVLAVMHAFGGPQGDLSASGWGLAFLALAAAVCVVSLLATAALFVADVRAGEDEEGPRR